MHMRNMISYRLNVTYLLMILYITVYWSDFHLCKTQISICFTSTDDHFPIYIFGFRLIINIYSRTLIVPPSTSIGQMIFFTIALPLIIVSVFCSEMCTIQHHILILTKWIYFCNSFKS